MKYYRVVRNSHVRKSWPTIRPLIIESDEEHPSYSQECRWVLFFRYSAFISRSWRSLLPTLLPSLFSTRQRKLIWPHESPVQPCPPPSPSSLLSRYPRCYVRPRLDLSRRCQQPLINVQEQPYCYVHRSSQRNAEIPWNPADFSSRPWRNQVEISKILRPFAIISKEIHLRITYVKLNISFLSNYKNYRI